MYDNLTAFIPKLRTSSFGSWTEDHAVTYDDVVYDLEQELHSFLTEHPELKPFDYREVLSTAKIKTDKHSIRSLDVSSLDGNVILGLIIHTFHRERMFAGTLLECFQEGYMEKWLMRLQKIDKQQGE